MLEDNNPEEIKAFLESLHPATVAEALSGELDPEQLWKFIQHTDIRTQATIFEYLPIEWQVKMAEGEGRERMAHLIEQMSHDDRVDLMRRLTPRARESLLRLVDEANRRDIATLVNQDKNTAGGLMTTDYAWLPPNITVTEALERLRLQAPTSETIYYIFVLDDTSSAPPSEPGRSRTPLGRRLLGVVSLRDLILAPRHRLIKDLMEEQVVSVRADMDREEVAKEMARYDLIAMPVVDDGNRMVGIITHDDVIDVVVQEATEDVHRMGGVGPITENYLEADFVTIWKKRAMWLSLLFAAELLTFTAMAQFEEQIAKYTVLALFIPLVISTGGNSGSQAATLITRSIALGHVNLRDFARVLRHELFMGFALGGTLGAIAFCRAFLVSEPVRGPVDALTLALILSQAVVFICLWGTLIGSMLPLVFRRLGFDPAIASSPFVATFVDVTGIIIFFSVSRIYLTF
jgi:magnesium transporter